MSVVESDHGRLFATPRRVDVRIPARPAAVREARQALDSMGLPEEVHRDARLLVTELVSNSVRHSGLGAQDTVHVQAEWSGRRLRVIVHDKVHAGHASRVAGAIRPSPTSESGWGLYLIDRLAKRWGIDGQGGYWFEMDVRTNS